MNPQLLRSFRDDFARSAEWRHEQKARLFAENQRKEQREEREDKAEQDMLDTMIEVLATETQIADFTVKLDRYDTATVEALMENQRDLDQVQKKLKDMFDKAHVLPDGRRVFKTEDGMRVFDEQGAHLSSTQIDPRQIDDRLTRWEEVLAHTAKHDALTAERRDLIEYQDKLDLARDRLSDDGLTEKELKDLEKTLDAQMPERVRKHAATADASEPAPEQATASERAAFRPGVRLDMPAL